MRDNHKTMWECKIASNAVDKFTVIMAKEKFSILINQDEHIVYAYMKV